MANFHLITDDLVELAERESNGVRVTLLWNRGTNRASVLVWDERSQETFTLLVRRDDKPLDLFHHPFAHSAHRASEGSAARTVARHVELH